MEKIYVNRTETFYCALNSKRCLARTGTVDQPLLSFFNCVLYTCSKTFKNMDASNRSILIRKVKDSIFDKISKREWEIDTLQNLRTNIANNLKLFYKNVRANDSLNENMDEISSNILKKLGNTQKEYDLFKIIIEVLPQDVILKDNNETEIPAFKKKVFSNVRKYLSGLDILKELDDEKVEHIIKGIYEFLQEMFTETENYILKKCKYTTATVTEKLLNEVSDYFNTNIYFLSAKTRMPYVKSVSKRGDYKNSIVLLEFEPENYEIVGELNDKNVIKREFTSTDKFMEEILKHLNKGKEPVQDSDEDMSDNNSMEFSEDEGVGDNV